MTLRIGDGKLEVTQGADTYSVTIYSSTFASETPDSSLTYAAADTEYNGVLWPVTPGTASGNGWDFRNTAGTKIQQYPKYVNLDGVKFFGGADDGWWEIPFPSWAAGKTKFFNIPVDRVFVSTNSYVTFRKGYDWYSANDILNTIKEPRIAICAGDRNCPGIRYGATGTAPNRRFVIKYFGDHSYSGTSGSKISWEMQFFESAQSFFILRYNTSHTVPSSLQAHGIYHSTSTNYANVYSVNSLPYSDANVTIFAKQVDGTLLFSSDRWNPNIFGVISDTMTKSDLPGYQDLMYGRAQGGANANFNYPIWNSISVTDYDFRTTNVNYFPGDGDYFLLPFAKVTLPTTGGASGLYVLGDTGGQWTSVQGGSVLRLYENSHESKAANRPSPFSYNPANYWPLIGIFQGSQILNFRASNGSITAEVSTKIGGTTSATTSSSQNSFFRPEVARLGGNLIENVNYSTRVYGRSGNQPQYNTGYTIEYKVYYGSIGSGNSISLSNTGTPGGDSTAGRLRNGIPGTTTYPGYLQNGVQGYLYQNSAGLFEVSDNGVFTNTTSLSINNKKRITYILTDGPLNLGYNSATNTTGYTIEFWYYIRRNENIPILTLQNKRVPVSYTHNNISGQYFGLKQTGVCEWTAATTAATQPDTQYYGLYESDRDVFEWNYYTLYISNTEFKTWVNGFDHYTGTQTLAVGGDQQYNMYEINTFILGGGPDYENVADSAETGTNGYFDNIRITKGDVYGKTLRRIPIPASRLTALANTTHLLSALKA